MAYTTEMTAGQNTGPQTLLSSFPEDGLAVIIGARGGIGSALLDSVQASPRFAACIGFSRSGAPALDLLSETSIAKAAASIAAHGRPPRLIIDATGFLHGGGHVPEKSWSHIDPSHMAHAFAVNALGPALLMKHFLPLLPRHGKAVFATLSAKVGSITDNHLGGWYSYRASKAALNQLVRTAAIELRRRRPDAICTALHPGTVGTGLSAPFAKAGLAAAAPKDAALGLLRVIDRLTPAQSGAFLDYRGNNLPW